MGGYALNLEKLFDIQRVLNERIVEEHNLDVSQLRNKKFLALLTELGELANETRCFKYWSSKGPSADRVILEEYVDCLHFILTIGLDFDFQGVIPPAEEMDSPDLTQRFINLYLDVNELVICASPDSYQELLKDFFGLGHALGFTKDDIYNGYLAKNRINHLRQDELY
jgi:dimeric dUTPase (all-alpha-NTP-PPase superfamily)